jgi:glutamate dehydrogenase (NAD(P)+)
VFLHEHGAKVIGISDSAVALHNEKGIDIPAAFAWKREHGTLRGFSGAEEIEPGELLELECDLLAPCALEQVITAENADRIKASLICEGANGPVTPEADEILEERGILVLPDILANAGGVVVSYFEWVQGLQQYFWSEQEVDSRLDAIITRAFEETWQLHEQRDLPLRLAAYALAVGRVANATTIRGIFP